MEWDRRPEVIETCLTCPLADCAGGKNCERRAAVIRRLLGTEETPRGPGKPRKRRTKYRYGGREMTLADWARETGISYGGLYWRVRRLGWDIARAIETPMGADPGQRRRGTGRRIEVGGQARTIDEWAETLGIRGDSLRAAILREGDGARAVRRRLKRRGLLG